MGWVTIEEWSKELQRWIYEERYIDDKINKEEKMKSKMLVCIQHRLTDEQRESLLKEFNLSFLVDENPELFSKLCNTPSDHFELRDLADDLLEMSSEYDAFLLPIGSPAFQVIFGQKSVNYPNIEFYFAHSERVSIEKKNEDGSVEKTSIFKHKGWIII